MKTATKPLVSIVIVNYNGRKDLEECISSLTSSTYPRIELIVVDNGSTDDSLSYLLSIRKKIFSLKILQNKRNLGFAEANNQGFIESEGELILLLNNDVVVESMLIEGLVKFLLGNKKVGIVQPKIIFYADKRLQSAGSFLTPFGFLYHYGYGQNPKSQRYEHSSLIFSANGACMLIRREVIEKVGLFDADFFAYYEETDFCHRVWLADYQIQYVPKVKLYHKGESTAEKLSKNFIFYHSFKNRLNSILKNFSSKNMIYYLILTIFAYSALILLYAFRFQLKISRAIFQAIVWNIKNLRETKKKRYKIQRDVRKVRDEDYLGNITRYPPVSYYWNVFMERETL